MIEGHKIIMRPQMPITSWVVSEKPSNKKGGDPKSFVIKQKWLTGERAAGGMQTGVSREPLFI